MEVIRKELIIREYVLSGGGDSVKENRFVSEFLNLSRRVKTPEEEVDWNLIR